jgi:hypothetical protein
LKLSSDELLSNFAFKFNLRRYIMGRRVDAWPERNAVAPPTTHLTKVCEEHTAECWQFTNPAAFAAPAAAAVPAAAAAAVPAAAVPAAAAQAAAA